jgi:hypothetical protein
LALATSPFPQELIKYLHTEEDLKDIYARNVAAELNNVEENESSNLN